MVPLHDLPSDGTSRRSVPTQLRFGGAKTKRVPILDYAPSRAFRHFCVSKITPKARVVVGSTTSSTLSGSASTRRAMPNIVARSPSGRANLKRQYKDGLHYLEVT